MREYEKPIKTTFANIATSGIITNILTLVNIYRIYFKFKNIVPSSSISAMLATIPPFDQVMAVTLCVLSACIFIMFELLYFMIQIIKKDVDYLQIYTASLLALMQIFIVAITLQESDTFHKIYATTFFIVCHLYCYTDIIATEQKLNNGSTVFNNNISTQMMLVIKKIVFMLLMIAMLLFMLEYIFPIKIGFSFTTWELAVISLCIVSTSFNAIKIINLKNFKITL